MLVGVAVASEPPRDVSLLQSAEVVSPKFNVYLTYFARLNYHGLLVAEAAIWLADDQLVCSRLHVPDLKFATGVAHRIMRMIEHVNPRTHPRVDVAP